MVEGEAGGCEMINGMGSAIQEILLLYLFLQIRQMLILSINTHMYNHDTNASTI